MRYSSLSLTILFGWLSFFLTVAPINSAQAADQKIIQYQGLSNLSSAQTVSIYLPALGGQREIGTWLSDSLAIYILSQIRSPIFVRIIRDDLAAGIISDSEAVRMASERSSESDFVIWGKAYSIDG